MINNNKNYDAYGKEIEVTKDDFKLTQVDKKLHDSKFDTKTTTFGKDAFRRFCKNKSSVVGAIIIGILTLLAFFVPVFSQFDVYTVHPEETLLEPKIKEPVKGVWNSNWNGTKVYTNVPYDAETGLPIRDGIQTSAIVAVKINEIKYLSQILANSYGGTFVFGSSKAYSNDRQVSYLEIYDNIDFTSTDNYVLKIDFADIDLSAADAYIGDEKHLGTTALGDYKNKGEYRVYLEYGEFVEGTVSGGTQNRKETHTIVLCDWSKDYSNIEVNISDAIAAAGITTAKNGKIRIEIKREQNDISYIALDSLTITSDSTDPEITSKLKAMGLEDAIDKLMLTKLNDGTFPLGYWRSNGDTMIYHNSYATCDFIYDRYEATYGKRIDYNDKVTVAKIQEYVDKGLCEYDFTVGPSSFKVLDEKCPITNVLEQNIIMSSGNEVYTFVTELTMYKYWGYDSMPKFLLGTDKSGYDLITRSFDGLRLSLILSIVVSALCLTFGLCWGAISGYFGGTIDLLMERFCDILGGVPWVVMMTLIILLMGNTVVTFGFALCMTGWMGTAARTRTQFYRFKGREYILASRTLGASDMRLIFHHVLPNAVGTIITGAVLSIPGVIFSEATISYLGLGLKGVNSFGVILSGNQQYLSTLPALIVFPAIIISLIMISFNLFGNGLRDALNPSLKGSE